MVARPTAVLPMTRVQVGLHRKCVCQTSVRGLNSGVMRLLIGAGEREERHPPAANLHAPLVEDFVDAVLTGRDPAVGGDTGRSVAQIEEQIYACADLRS